MLIIGHRGAKGHYPENTLLSFQKAMAIGAHGIELDVHLSSDGEIVVIHDEKVNRVSNGTGFVKEIAAPELKKLKISTAEGIPMLHEVFDVLPNCLINVELKVKETAKPVVNLIEKYVLEKNFNYSQFLVSSFDWTALQQVRDLHDKIPLGVLTETDLDLAIAFAKFIRAETIHPHFHLLTKKNTMEMQQLGFRVFAWTANEPEDILQLKSFNIDAIITDFPERI
jgi:glycerophosphoryl diester phosphodiesterase